MRNKSPTRDDLEKLGHREQVCFTIHCAESVFSLIKEKDKPVCRAAIDAAIGFVEGRVSKEDCRSAYAAAYAAYAAADAAADASYAAATDAADAADAAAASASASAAAAADAAYAAYAAAYAADAAYDAKDRQSIIDAQWELYDDLLNLDLNLISVS